MNTTITNGRVCIEDITRFDFMIYCVSGTCAKRDTLWK